MTTQQTETPSAQTPTPTTNGTILLVKIKPGQVDALRAAVGKYVHNLTDPQGGLAKIGTVHFARFAIIDDTYFLFASHFDGDFDAYLDDFFSFNRAVSFDLVFRYIEDWPGPNDREGFMRFWKSHKVPDLALYSYYPGVTCKEIEKALRIRSNMEAVLQDFQ